MTFSIFKRAALVLGGAALLLTSTVGLIQAEGLKPESRPAHHVGLKRLVHAELSVAATTLGLPDAKALRKELAGTTLSAVAAQHNVALATVASAMKSDITAKIQALVTSGKIKPERAAKLIARAEARIDKLMTHEFKPRKEKS
jgi:ribonuclease PH